MAGRGTPKEPKRCWWPGKDPLYVAYHDEEWGVPVRDDRMLFESLCLDGQQAGLSWITVLKKRERYRRRFMDFDIDRVARMSDRRLEKLLEDPGLIRNRLKIHSIRANAQACQRTRRETGGFSEYIWSFVGGRTLDGRRRAREDVPATSPESDAMARDLKKRGFSFVGSTICYAFMQACGLINDHTADCFRYRQLKAGTARRARPGETSR